MGLVVVDEGFEQPVGTRGPQVQWVLAAEVVRVAGLAVGVGGGHHAPGPEDRAGVVAPVGQAGGGSGRRGPR
ncbi:hypothetical protein BSAF29S_00325 [Bacillus safensis subsp. safensis]